MPRAKAILQSEYPYQITARCINREWFSIPMKDVWAIFVEELNNTSEQLNLSVQSFVLMSNHFHLIAFTPEANISDCMHRLMYTVSKRLTQAGNRINGTFAGRHYKCVLSHRMHYLNAYKYNYQNPVRAGICKRVEDYPFSTLYGLIGKTKHRVQMAPDHIYLSDPIGVLDWLNTKPDPKKLEGVRYGLKRPYFKSKKERSTGKALIDLNELL